MYSPIKVVIFHRQLLVYPLVTTEETSVFPEVEMDSSLAGLRKGELQSQLFAGTDAGSAAPQHVQRPKERLKRCRTKGMMYVGGYCERITLWCHQTWLEYPR